MSSHNASGADTPQSVPVLAAVIRRGDTYLLCRRPAHKRHGGLWEFPGGKLESGESIEDAAVRELAEELGVEVTSVGDVVYEISDSDSPFIIEFAFVEINGDPVAVEHDELLWVGLGKMVDVNLAPADRSFAQWLRHVGAG